MPGKDHGATTRAEDLQRGDVFTFRRTSYHVLSTLTDRRRPQTVVTAVPADAVGVKKVVVLQLIRTFGVLVTGKRPVELEVLRNTRAEADRCTQPELSGQ